MKTKRILSLVLTVCLLFSCVATLASCFDSIGQLEFQSISVDKTTVITEYTVGDPVDFSDIKVSVRYNDSTQSVRVGFSKLTFEYDGKELKEDADFAKLTETEGEKVITVKYYDDVADKEWKTATITITVNDAVLPEFVSMTLQADSVKTQFCVGDPVDFSGILVDILYENSENNEVVATYADLTLVYDEDLTATEGTKTVTVKYQDDVADLEEKSITFDVTVGYPTFSAFEAEDAPTECYIGDTVDFSGILFTLTYEEGSAYTKTLTADKVSFSALDTAAAGVKTVTVTYDDHGEMRETSFSITVKNPVGKSLDVVASTITTVYGVGDEAAFDSILAHAVYEQTDFNCDLHFSDLTFTVGEDGALADLTKTEGKKTVNVSYRDAYGNTLKTSVEVTVELRFVSFEIVASSVDTTYYKDDAYNFSGLQAEIKYNNETYNTVVSGEQITVTGTENLTAEIGEKTITVTYLDPKFDNAERTATIKISVAAPGFKSVELVTEGVKNEYAIGDEIDLTGLKFTVDYENPELDGTFDYTDPRITVSSLTDLTAAAGTKNIEITYEDENGTKKTMTFTVSVKAPVYQSAQVNLNGFAVEYKLGDAQPDFSGITVSTVYDNAKCNATIANAALTFSGDSNLTAVKVTGKKTITISFNDYNGAARSVTFDVTVTAPVYDATNTALDRNGVKNEYYVTDAADDFTKVKVNVVYDLADFNKTLSGTDITVDSSKVDLTKAGTYTVTVKFKDPWLGNDRTLTFDVTVKAPTLQKTEVSGVETVYAKDATVDFSGLKVTLTYDPAAYSKEYTGAALTYNIDGLTSALGKKKIEISYADPYKEGTLKAYLNVTVGGGTVNVFESPDSISLRANAIKKAGTAAYGEEGFEGQFFAGQDTTYYIGDDNAFIFQPSFALYDYDDVQVTGQTLMIDTVITAGGKTLTKKKGTAANTYDYYDGETLIVTANLTKYSYDFTDDAVGKEVTLTLTPNSALYTYDGSAVTLTAKVIDAYNVYTGADLCVIDNRPTYNHGYSKYGTQQWWDEFKTAKGYAGISVNGIVLQNDITLKAEDLPDSFFVTSTAEITVTGTDEGGNEKTIVYPAGSKFLNDGLDIYDRVINNGETFTIQGNYFTLDAEKFPTIPSTGMKDSITGGLEYGSDFSNTSLFRFSGNAWEGMDKTNYSVNCNLSNISLKGNANRNENKDAQEYLVSAGGLILAKNTNCTMTYTNTISKCFFINYFPDDNGDDYTDATIANVVNCKCFDSFQNAAFVWGHATLNITGSYIQRCGGPLAILQHVKPNDNPTSRIPTMNATDSVLESFVDAKAFWFTTVGATEAASNIAGLSGVLSGYGLGSYVNSKSKMNMVALIMSNGTSAAETMSNIAASGTVTLTKDGKTTVLDRTTNTAIGQTVRYLYENNPALGAAPIYAVGDADNAANSLVFVNQVDTDYRLFTPQPLGDLATNANYAAYASAYTNSSYVTLNYGGFGLMFELIH